MVTHSSVFGLHSCMSSFPEPTDVRVLGNCLVAKGSLLNVLFVLCVARPTVLVILKVVQF